MRIFPLAAKGELPPGFMITMSRRNFDASKYLHSYFNTVGIEMKNSTAQMGRYIVREQDVNSSVFHCLSNLTNVDTEFLAGLIDIEKRDGFELYTYQALRFIKTLVRYLHPNISEDELRCEKDELENMRVAYKNSELTIESGKYFQYLNLSSLDIRLKQIFFYVHDDLIIDIF